jgi:hypothetical protein
MSAVSETRRALSKKSNPYTVLSTAQQYHHDVMPQELHSRKATGEYPAGEEARAMRMQQVGMHKLLPEETGTTIHEALTYPDISSVFIDEIMDCMELKHIRRIMQEGYPTFHHHNKCYKLLWPFSQRSSNAP